MSVRRLTFGDRDTCARCGGPLVRRRDGLPGRRCARCGIPEPGVPLTLAFGGTSVPVLARRGWSR
ncbi:MAG TPA: hypothetical protein VNO79_15980 [Actinomycetota bacterium]|nr:hypothetical protein [Actinomycetota bacterium]